MPLAAGLLGGLGKEYQAQKDYNLRKQELENQTTILKGAQAERSLHMQQLGMAIEQSLREQGQQRQLEQFRQGPQQGFAVSPTNQPGQAAPAFSPDQGQPAFGAPGVQGPPPEGMEGPGPVRPPGRQGATNQPSPAADTIMQTDVTPDLQRQQSQASETLRDRLVQVGRDRADLARVDANTSTLYKQAANPDAHAFLGSYVQNIAPSLGADPRVVPFLRATAMQETGNSAHPYEATGTSGEYGAFQFMPETAKRLGFDPTDFHASTKGAVQYAQQLGEKYGWDYAKMGAGWNAGETRVDKGDIPQSTREQYVPQLMAKLGLAPAPQQANGAAPSAGVTMVGGPATGLPKTGSGTDQLYPPLRTPETLTNPLDKGPVADAQQEYDAALNAQRFNRAKLNDNPSYRANPKIMEQMDRIDARVDRSRETLTKATETAVGQVSADLNDYVQQRTGMSAADLYRKGPKGDGLGGPEMLQEYRRTLPQYRANVERQQKDQAMQQEAGTKRAIERDQSLDEVRKGDAHNYKDTQTGQTVNTGRLWGDVQQGVKERTVISLAPKQAEKVNELNDARAQIAYGHSLFQAAQGDVARAKQEAGILGQNFETYWQSNSGKYPNIAAYNAFTQGPGMTAPKALGVPEKQAAAMFPSQDMYFDGERLASGALMAAAGAGIVALGAATGGGFGAGFVGAHEVVQGGKEMTDAFKNGRTITHQDLANQQWKVIAQTATLATGSLLQNPGFSDPALAGAINTPPPVYRSSAGMAPQAGQSSMSPIQTATTREPGQNAVEQLAGRSTAVLDDPFRRLERSTSQGIQSTLDARRSQDQAAPAPQEQAPASQGAPDLKGKALLQVPVEDIAGLNGREALALVGDPKATPVQKRAAQARLRELLPEERARKSP